ncbi:MAG: hypothetical protein AB8F65_01760 [Woeseiaceae bacterium]
MSALLRFGGYTLLLLLIIGLPVLAELNSPGSTRLLIDTHLAPTLGTSEYSLVEWQQVFILMVIIGFALLSTRWGVYGPVLGVLLASMGVVALVRELDFFLDAYLLDHSWQVIVAMIVVVVSVYVWRMRADLQKTLDRMQPSIGLSLILVAWLFLTGFVGVIGHEPFWEHLLGDAYVRIVKIAVEELSELAGYWLWLVGQIEVLVQSRYLKHFQTSGDRRRRS